MTKARREGPLPPPGARSHAPGTASSAAGDPPPLVVEVDAPAKVNLFLRVLGREPSGYHGVRTLFQSLELADRVRVERIEAPGVELDVFGMDVGPPKENLLYKAAVAFLEAAGAAGGVRVRLEKRIPPGGGLGGGSSDAAAALTALDRLHPAAVARPGLLELAASLGSDVPFFLCGSPLALGEGRGERLTPLPPLPAADVILALPAVSVSTAWAYGALDRRREATGGAAPPPAGEAPRPRAHTDAREAEDAPGAPGDWDSLARMGVNDFEDVVLEEHSLVAAAGNALRTTGASMVLLSGSGSSVFALYPEPGSAERAHAALRSGAEIRFVLTRTRTAVPEPDVVPETE